ncbi:MAG: hypothetical protein FJ271_13565 [Planctomycetes bacterium]|nr:hypothetical protein [Planctomycetota bacterium]
MRANRPPAVTFVAVANMIFGVLGILCACFNGVIMAFMASISANDPDPMLQGIGQYWDFIVRNIPAYVPVEIGLSIYYLVISVLAITGSIGLLSLRNWGRMLSLIFGISMILVQFAYLLFFFAFVNPVLNRFEGRQGAFGGDGIMGTGFLEAGSSLLALIYAIVVVILLFLPSVSAAFAFPPGRFPDGDWGEP